MSFMPERLAASIAALQEMVLESGIVAGFTGAGISTESGIPDFRSPGSAWMRHKPIPLDVFLSNEEARREAWRRKFAMDDLCRNAQPSRGHRALMALAASGRMPAVITQNIDGLHQESGLSEDQVIELHGNGTYASCLSCGQHHGLGEVRARFEATAEVPACSACGGIVKVATVSFGQAMPAPAMARARRLALSCDLMIVLGSSLVVFPAAGFPLLAKENGARLVIVNREPTPLDREASLVIHAEIGDVLAPFLRVI